MKANKGFTLIELLVVIAVLAVLAIIAMPNILKLFVDTRKDTFTTDLNETIRTAKLQYLNDGGHAIIYSNAEDCDDHLQLQSGVGYRYIVIVDEYGTVIGLHASNGLYQYSKDVASGIKRADSDDVELVEETSALDIDVKYREIADL